MVARATLQKTTRADGNRLRNRQVPAPPPSAQHNNTHTHTQQAADESTGTAGKRVSGGEPLGMRGGTLNQLNHTSRRPSFISPPSPPTPTPTPTQNQTHTHTSVLLLHTARQHRPPQHRGEPPGASRGALLGGRHRRAHLRSGEGCGGRGDWRRRLGRRLEASGTGLEQYAGGKPEGSRAAAGHDPPFCFQQTTPAPPPTHTHSQKMQRKNTTKQNNTTTQHNTTKQHY